MFDRHSFLKAAHFKRLDRAGMAAGQGVVEVTALAAGEATDALRPKIVTLVKYKQAHGRIERLQKGVDIQSP